MVVLSRPHFLRKDGSVDQPLLQILLVEPEVFAFVVHDLNDAISIQLLQLLFVHEILQAEIASFVLLPPLLQIFAEHIACMNHLRPKLLLVITVLLGHLLLSLFQELLLNGLLVHVGLLVDSSTGLSHELAVIHKAPVVGSHHTRLRHPISPRNS